MSNPFADPTSRSQALDDNPFADTSDPTSNPYGNSRNPAAGASTYSLDLDDTPKPSQSQSQQPVNASKGYNLPTFGFGSGSGSGAVPAGLDEREEALRRQDEELKRRQRELDERERRMDMGEGKANWPFFFPLIRHEIADLPATHQKTMKSMYYQWLALVVTLVVNLVACVLLLIAGSSDGGKDTAAAGSYVGIITVTSFFLWYRPIYLGYAKENGLALFFYLYFFFAGWHLLFVTYMLIGIPSTGSAGLINTISMLSQGHIAAGVLGAVSSAGWTLQVLGGGWLYRSVWAFKNQNEGISWENAQSQFKQESFKTVVLHQSRI